MSYSAKCKKSILLALLFLILPPPKINAQQARPQPEVTPPAYDLSKERAADLAFSAGHDASGLTNLSDRIGIQLEAVRVLAAARPEQAAQLLDSAWAAVTGVIEAEKTKESARGAASRLRVNVLALYAKLDPERAKKLEKSLPSSASDAKHEGSRTESQTDASPDRQRADYLVRAGLEQLKVDPAGGVNTALSSLGTGKISFHLSVMPKAILAKAGREAASSFENRVAAALSNRSSLDEEDYLTAVYFLRSDEQMPVSARRGLISFLFNSLQSLVQIVRQNPNKQFPGGEVETFKSAYSTLTRSVRAHVAADLPDKLSLFDAYLGEVAAVVPQSWLDFHYELWTTDAAEDQLARALKTADPKSRDARLMSLTVRALNGKLPGRKDQQLDYAAKAVAEIKDEGTRAVLQDFLRMAEVMKLVGEKLLPAAADKAKSVSRPDWRAWVLLGLADAQAKENQGAARALHEEAWRALEKSPASPRKAELAFLLARFVGGYDQTRAAEIVASAVRYANQAAEGWGKEWAEPTLLESFFVRVGSQHFAPGQELSGVGEIGFGDEVGDLARHDWTLAESLGKDIKDLGLRLRYQLAMSRGVLAGTKGN